MKTAKPSITREDMNVKDRLDKIDNRLNRIFEALERYDKFLENLKQ